MFVGDEKRRKIALPSQSPGYGRFMETDPIGYGDGLNWYNYVGSDPVNATDPTGTEEGDIVITGNRLGYCDLNPFSQFCNGGSGGATYGSTSPFEGGGGGSAGDIIVTATRVKPKAPVPGKLKPCLPARKESGAITFEGLGGSGAFVLGASVVRGAFTNVKTGTTGSFTTTSFLAGLDLSGATITGRFSSLGSFAGGNDNYFWGIGPYTKTNSYTFDGNYAGYSEAYGFSKLPIAGGTSTSITELSNITQTSRCERQ